MYRWVDHTAELELAIEAGSEREVFADALAALGELWGASPGSGGGSPASAGSGARRKVAADAPDRGALLAGWMEELVFLAESEGFVGTELERLQLSADSVQATVTGRLGEPAPIVKAITYHGLVFERSPGGYLARVVLDV